MIDWSQFILEGFSNEREKLGADKELLKYGPTLQAKEDELEVKWYTKDGLKYYTVVCRCGNNRMLYHDNGIRCHICGRFHSHDNFNKKRLEARRLAKLNDGRIPKKPQPFYEQAMGVQRRRLRSRAGHALLNRNGNGRLGAGPIEPNSE